MSKQETTPAASDEVRAALRTLAQACIDEAMQHLFGSAVGAREAVVQHDAWPVVSPAAAALAARCLRAGAPCRGDPAR